MQATTLGAHASRQRSRECCPKRTVAPGDSEGAPHVRVDGDVDDARRVTHTRGGVALAAPVYPRGSCVRVAHPTGTVFPIKPGSYPLY